MKKLSVLIVTIAISFLGYSQEINTLFSSKDTTVSFGGYGSPILRASQINGIGGVAIGGKGGFTINQKFTFGGIGYGHVSDYVFKGDNLAGKSDVDLHIGMGAGGVFFEYTIGMKNAVHFSIPLNIMAGGVFISDKSLENNNDDDIDETIEKSGIFLLESGINIEFNFTKFFMPTLNIGYRHVMGSSLKNLTDEELSGFHIGLVLKFGKF